MQRLTSWVRQLTTTFVCIGVGAAVASFAAEPKFNGKSLRHWVERYSKAPDGSAEEKQAEAAIRSIGTNSVPFLVQWIAENQSGVQLESADAFKVLGPTAASAVSELGKMLMSTNELVNVLAGTALGNIGEPSLPVLMAALTNRSFRVATDAAHALVELGTNARPAVPILVGHLAHPNHFYRERAANVLGQMHLEPETVVPALTRVLKDESKATRYLAVSGLGEFGSLAQSAIPAVTELLTDPDDGVRSAATNALHEIAPKQFPKPVRRPPTRAVR